MRYNLRLSIGYKYGAPSDHARTLVRMLPSDLPGRQTISTRLLDIEPRPSERRDIKDFFGNATTVLMFHHPIDRIEFRLKARADRSARIESLDLSPDRRALAADLATVTYLTSESPHHYLGPSSRVTYQQEIADFAAEPVTDGQTIRQVVEALGRAIHSEMRFDPEATEVDTPLGEAFAKRHGVCQDFSHVMIAGLRSLDIPARYVSGFLRTIPPPGQARLEGADAMHAWVSAWCGAETGWVEYDPTNACWVGQDHIAVAYGRDYSDVAPVKGTLRTAGDQTSHQRVDVEPI